MLEGLHSTMLRLFQNTCRPLQKVWLANAGGSTWFCGFDSRFRAERFGNSRQLLSPARGLNEN
jgi:hypothetical protein